MELTIKLQGTKNANRDSLETNLGLFGDLRYNFLDTGEVEVIVSEYEDFGSLKSMVEFAGYHLMKQERMDEVAL